MRAWWDWISSSACSSGFIDRFISNSIDGKPVDLVFLLLIPATAGGEHLATLAAISRRLRDKEFAANLRKAASGTTLYHLLCEPHHAPKAETGS